MNRRSLIKSLFTIAVAPKILSELNFEAPLILNNGPTKKLVSSLQLLTPHYYKAFVEKYGAEDFTFWMDVYGKTVPVNENKYFWYERSRQNNELCQNT